MNRHALVLAIEPDLRQAAIVKRVVKERVQADVVVVDSRDAAIAAIKTAIPDVLLVSVLLSPRDEEDVIAHLRTLEAAAHLQTHTIPQLASSLGHGDDDGGGGLFSAFRRKKASAAAPAGCDPDLFADEIRVYIERAVQKKREAAEGGVRPMPAIAAKPVEKTAVASEAPSGAAPGSSWESPFEWRPSSHTRVAAPPPVEPEPVPTPAFQPVEPLEPLEPLEAFAPIPEPEPVAVAAPPRPKVHTPAPLSVWARKETKTSEAPPTAELSAFFARLGVPDTVASIGYPEGVRIRRVRVRAAKESHPSLHGAMLLGRRMIAELRGTDAGA